MFELQETLDSLNNVYFVVRPLQGIYLFEETQMYLENYLSGKRFDDPLRGTFLVF